MDERFNYRLVRDLFAHKEAIFGELKRASTLSHSGSAAGRSRAISTDESKRREHMEARNQAIASRSRASSPAPSPARGHRRDRSSGGPATRFPVATHTSPTTATDRHSVRQSLDVPGGKESSSSATSKETEVNGGMSGAGPSDTPLPPRPNVGRVRKQASLGKNVLGTEPEVERYVGVELVDKPMDD